MTKLPCLRVFADLKLVSMALACGVALSGCMDEDELSAEELELMSEDDGDDDNDPARWLGAEQWWDEGPPAGEVEGEVETDALDLREHLRPTLAPSFQLPFPCGQVWAGQTRKNHSPVNSIDFNRANDIGDKVVAAAGGTVTRVANEGNVSYGRWVEVDHGSGYRTRYAHLNTQSVSVGQSVSKGQKLGTVGSTGGSSGPHLHYEVRLNGTAVKPVFNGSTALFFGTKNYTSKNKCSSGGGATGTVNTNNLPLTVRAGASTNTAAVGSVADGAKVTISCQKYGSSVKGTYGTTTVWDFIGTGYISDAYVYTGSDGLVAPLCK